jgi:hypothetical protein
MTALPALTIERNDLALPAEDIEAAAGYARSEGSRRPRRAENPIDNRAPHAEVRRCRLSLETERRRGGGAAAAETVRLCTSAMVHAPRNLRKPAWRSASKTIPRSRAR